MSEVPGRTAAAGATIPDPGGSWTPFVELRETHTGLVALCGDRAYKVKKPVAIDVLDFRTAAQREHACARELELNRRLAPDVYLGVAHLDDPAGGPAEPVLVMRRMPETARLATILDNSDTARTELTALAKTLAAFHAGARRGPDIDAEATPDGLRARWRSLLDPLRGLPDDVIDPERLTHIERLALRYIDGREPLWHSRIAAGRVVDGHGDLLAEDIFDTADGFRVLDCVEFDDRLRYVDAIDDICFLAMDLEFRGHAESAERLVGEYVRETGDRAPGSLIHHYIAYRALARAEVDAVRLAQGVPASRPHVRHHLDLARRHLTAAAVRLALIGGPPGTGKSTLAAGLAAVTDATVISAEAVRKALRHKDGAAEHHPSEAAVHTEMLARARRQLSYGRSVVLDDTWSDAGERARAAELAAATAADLVEIRCDCAPATASHRLPHGTANAVPSLAAAMEAMAAAWPSAHAVDTGHTPQAALAAARRVWDRSQPR